MTQPWRTVLVDDHAPLRQLYRIALEATGTFRVEGEAEDGQAGIEAAKVHRPDLVLLDLSMPQRDGLESILEIRQASPGSHVVVLSGFRRERLEPTTRELGASGYIEKGISPLDLKEALEKILATPLPPMPQVDAARMEDLRERVAQLV